MSIKSRREEAKRQAEILNKLKWAGCQGLTVLSFGGGQDSTAILYKIVYDPEFRKRFVKGDLLVIMADTGNEHTETYKHVGEISKFCAENGINFVFLPPDSEYIAPSWRGGLVAYHESHQTVPLLTGRKSCTVKLKVDPIYKYLNQYVHEIYGTEKVARKAALYEFTKYCGKIHVLIGIGAEEAENRISDEAHEKWMEKNIKRVYPLVDIGWSRKECQDYIRAMDKPLPPPSNCIFCPFMNKPEILWLYRFDRPNFEKLAKMEALKMETHEERFPGTKNHGVFGEKNLWEKLEEAQQEFGHMTDDELQEYKMSHGHCVKSKM